MHPDFFRVGPLTIHAYGVMMALGFLAGLVNWHFIGRREGRDIKFCSDLLFAMMVAGVVGGRLAYVISDFAYFRAQPLKIFRIDEGGLIYYGGFLGALLAVFVFARMYRESFLKLGDFVITSLPLAHAFWPGRLLPERMLLRPGVERPAGGPFSARQPGVA
jgi:phosphatidylglycerol---prolipoprotein diacylglyceryl transferase